MATQAHENMSIEEQVEFAWVHRDYFEEVRLHNLELTARRYRGDMTAMYRNAWAELAHLVDEVKEAA